MLFEKLDLNEPDVKRGTSSKDVVMACRSVNVALFLSGNLRRDVIISIAIRKNAIFEVISFPASKIKRVSPDERSISFFLLKAKRSLKDITVGESTQMPNNIILEKKTVGDLLEEWKPNCIYLSRKIPYLQKDYQDISEKSLFIYSTSESLEVTGAIELPRPKYPERFILDVNNWFDERDISK